MSDRADVWMRRCSASVGPMTTCRMQGRSASVRSAVVPAGARVAWASNTVVSASVSHQMGASGAIRAGSAKGVKAPTIASGRLVGDVPDALTGWETVKLGLTGTSELKVALVVVIAAQALPGDLFVVQRQNVVVGRHCWRPTWNKRGRLGCHGSTAHAGSASSRTRDMGAGMRSRCRRGERHDGPSVLHLGR